MNTLGVASGFHWLQVVSRWSRWRPGLDVCRMTPILYMWFHCISVWAVVHSFSFWCDLATNTYGRKNNIEKEDVSAINMVGKAQWQEPLIHWKQITLISWSFLCSYVVKPHKLWLFFSLLCVVRISADDRHIIHLIYGVSFSLYFFKM